MITDFFIPLAASTYRVGVAIALPVGVLFIARLYGISIGPAQSVTVILTVVVTTFSVPGIPGGGILVMVPALLAAGVPVEGIGTHSRSTRSPTRFAPLLTSLLT